MGRSIGRNEPCFCGSGKKYKHCCLRKQQLAPPETNPADEIPLPDEDEIAQDSAHLSAPEPATAPAISLDGLINITVGLALVAGVLWWVGYGDAAIIIFGIGLIVALFWSAVRKPPPPRGSGDDPSSINFGR